MNIIFQIHYQSFEFDGGMAFHGGFIGVILAVILFCWKNKISLWSTADLIAVSTPPGLFFGRVANFINSELWGRPQKFFGELFFQASELNNVTV